MTYINPFIADVTEKGAMRRHLYAEAESGLLAAGPNGSPLQHREQSRFGLYDRSDKPRCTSMAKSGDH